MSFFIEQRERERERENRLTEGAQAVERRQFLVTLRMKCISHPIVLNMKPPQKHILRHPSKWDSLFKSVKKKKEPHNNVTAEELWQLRFLHAADTYRTDTFYVSLCSHFMFMTSLEGDGAPKQGRQLKAVFQHLWVWSALDTSDQRPRRFNRNRISLRDISRCFRATETGILSLNMISC